ncbi:hypothetical protein CRG98_020864 [Punica granatum]|uniref:Uncharacterized protein n=1 Tax=Punica granatum TaxID=22663 RepID=A0A2I0JR33_PUNGR|nr:hypothetical protein CRG98_020864 [Punica granatum]
MDAPAPPTLHASVAQPLTNPYPPLPAPTAVPLPPAAFLTSDQVLSAPPPVSMPAPAAAYTIPPPTVFPTSGDQIQPISPGPNFDPSIQDQSKRCEYHQGAPGHTLDNCWRLKDEIQKRIDSNQLTFNAVRPPNVQANPLPDHWPSSGPSINMISICVPERNEEAQENPPPFVINYTPEEFTVGFTGHGASPAPFIVDVPAQGLYSDSKSPTAKDKGKAPSVENGATPESSPFSSKKLTEEEAETFMKIVKASEYKVVEQMAKSPAHISLLALLLGSEPHREALLRVLTAAQVPKGTPPDRIEETIGSIFSDTISFSDDELPSEGWSHSRALHIVCKCNNYIIGRIHSAGAVPSSLHQWLKFVVEEKLITVKGEEDYAIYKETAVVRTRMWTLVGARIARFWIARLGRNVHLPVGTRV